MPRLIRKWSYCIPPNKLLSKFQLRQQFRDVRKHIPLLYGQKAMLSMAAHFTQQSFFKQSQHIACYLAVNDELDCTLLIEAIWQAKKHCYLPVLTDHKTLHFTRYQQGDALHANRYAILEPINISRIITPENLDCVAMPLLAFDQQGHRLGTGGGYYDRTFAFLLSAASKTPSMIGIAYAAQEAEILPDDPWDVPMQAVVTEKEVVVV